MKQPLLFLIAILAAFTASAQQPVKDSTNVHPGSYNSDSFRLRTPGRRISFYTFCTPYSDGRAVYFRKDQDEAIHRFKIQNLRVALADNPASMRQLRIASTDAYLTIGLFAGGIALAAAGFIITSNQITSNHDHDGSLSPLVFIGAASLLSCIIPIAGRIKHTQKAIDIYNGD